MKTSDYITKRIQNLNLETYKMFAEFCQKHDLQYFAISGTALGAELWNGFIPWDDDMDIAMPIQDFEKLRNKLHKKLPDPYAFVELLNLGGKIHNKNTTLIEAPQAFSPKHYHGVFIDIVPLIGIPDNLLERKSFLLEVKRYIAEATAVDFAPELKIFTGQDKQRIKTWRQDLISRYPFGKTKYCTDFSCVKCPAYLTSGFQNPVLAEFEDTTIPTSSNQLQDLKTAYGKIIKNVPPEERQLSHHNFYAYCDLKTPCAKYSTLFNSPEIPSWFKEMAHKDHLFGISSNRESNLYKNYCQELEKKLLKAEADINKLRKSSSYKLGNSIIKPVAKIKKIFSSSVRPK